MRKLKSLLVLVLASVLVLSACATNNSTATPTPSPPPPTPAEETPVIEEDVPNLNGRVIKIAAWWDQTPAGATQSEINRLDKMAEVEAKYNVKFEFVTLPFEEVVSNLTTSSLAGEPFADIVQLEYKSALPLIMQGLILPISEFTDETNNINNEANLLEKYPPINGDYYAFESPNSLGAGIHYNRDIFNNLGLEDPKEIYARGEWTWDKFLELAKAATKDTNNDGTPDVYGFSGWAPDVFRHFAASNGVKLADEVAKIEGLSSPGSIETGEFLNQLYNIDKVVKISTGNPMEWEEYNGFKSGDVAMFTTAEWNLKDLPFSFGIVPIPKGPNAIDGITYADYLKNGKFIPKGVKDAALIFKIFEESLDIPMLEEYSGQDYLESLYFFEDDVEMLRDHIAGTGLISVEDGFPDFPAWPFVNDIVVNQISPATAAETYKAQADAALRAFEQ